ncbi:MAG: DnaJ domain-containing protein [Candidatus Gracilibacteria bacterium]|nr:DnaJ domain-containing protein [Candidatus Gracilibacteria bacterium]
MSNNFYDTLGVNKNASADEIKKAYRKQAMKYHPDRNKGDTSAEKKFKEVNEAYTVLSDAQQKKQYDTFGSAKGSPFGSGGFGGQSTGQGGFGGFEDMFSQFGGAGGSQQQGSHFDFEDLFGGSSQGRKTQAQEKPISLDFEKTYEIPIFDLILGCKIEVSGVYGQKAKLKIPAHSKPGSKFRVKDFGKSEGLKKGHLIVKVDARMPKHISDVDLQMLERIRENIGY